MNHLHAGDYQDMSRKAAAIIAGQILSNPHSILGFATGGTPTGTYQELVRLHEEGLINFSAITAFNLDEYVGIPADDPQSYYTFMQEHLFSLVNIDPAHCHIPNGQAKDLNAECLEYEQAIAKAGGIDLQLLGIGHNGHIAFNEPCDAFPLTTHLVELNEKTIQANARFYESADEVPKTALTMGIGTIFKAKKLLMLAGPDKADIIHEAFHGKITPQVPASILQLHPNFTLISHT